MFVYLQTYTIGSLPNSKILASVDLAQRCFVAYGLVERNYWYSLKDFLIASSAINRLIDKPFMI